MIHAEKMLLTAERDVKQTAMTWQTTQNRLSTFVVAGVGSKIANHCYKILLIWNKVKVAYKFIHRKCNKRYEKIYRGYYKLVELR